jgi:hypothetical protein
MASDIQLTPEEETRLVLRSAIPDLPEAVRTFMLSDPVVLRAMGLPDGDFIRLWDKRFHRHELFDALRAVANGEPAKLASVDRKLEADESWLDDDGAGVLRSGQQAARFVNVALLCDDAVPRMAMLDTIVTTGEVSAAREAFWRQIVAAGPLDDPQLIALETELGESPEAAYRTMVQEITAGEARFDDLVPLEPGHYAGLLATAPSDDLDSFMARWLEAAATLDATRLRRLLALSAPLSMLKGGLVAQASDNLSPSDRVSLVQHLQGAPDPFSVAAAFEIACRHYSNPEMAPLADAIAPRLFDKEDPLITRNAPALEALVAITTALTARYRTLTAWPLYARRLGRFVHASHLLRLFADANVDPAIFEDQAMRSFGPQARLADLCDIREVPVWQPHLFNMAMIHAMLIARATAAIAEIPEETRPEPWIKAGEQTLAALAGSEWALFLFSATPFSELHGDWNGLTQLDAEDVEAARSAFVAKDNLERSLSDLIKLSVSFEVPIESRHGLAMALPPFIESLEGTNFLFACEVVLQLAARWRDTVLSDAVVDLALQTADKARLVDAGAAPRLTMLAAAAEAEPPAWRKRAGNIAQSFAFAQKAGAPSINLMRALELLRDFEPQLGPELSSARSFTSLAFDRIPADPS